MGLFQRFVDYFAAEPQDDVKPVEADVIQDDMTDNTDIGWYSLSEIAARMNSGGNITADSAFSRIGTVFACVDRRATTLSKLPFQVYRHTGGGNRERAYGHRMDYLLTVRPNRYQSPMMYKKYIMLCQLLWGFACVYKKLAPNGEILELIPWNPKEVGIHKLLDRNEYVYQYRGRTYTEDEVIYIPYISADGKRGKAPMTVAREAAEAVDNMTRHLRKLYKNGAIKQGALKVGSPLSPEAKRKLKKEWTTLNGGANNSGEPAVLDNGIEFEDISLPMSDAQFIESKRLTALDIAAIFNVPGSSVGLAQEKYSNLQEINDRFIQDVVAPDCINIEEAHNFSCFLQGEKKFYTKFNISAGMRGAPDKRVAYYEKMLQMGVLTINEIRALEEMNGIGELGDKHYASLNFTTLDTLEKHERIKQEE